MEEARPSASTLFPDVIALGGPPLPCPDSRGAMLEGRAGDGGRVKVIMLLLPAPGMLRAHLSSESPHRRPCPSCGEPRRGAERKMS